MSSPALGVVFTLDLQDLEALAGAELQFIEAAVKRGAFRVAEYIKAQWVLNARNAGVWDSGNYVRGIEEESRVDLVSESSAVSETSGGSMTVSVVIDIVNTCPYASVIEDGHEAFHLPSKIDWARTARAKVAADGTRYLTIPFRHAAYQSPSARTTGGMTRGTEARMMPRQIYDEAKKLQASHRLMAGEQRTASGQFVAADRYKWGGRLERGDVPVGAKAPGRTNVIERRSAREIAKGMVNPAWKTSKFQGMTRFEHLRADGGRSSTYLTFRVLTEKSTGWNIPAQEGRGIARMTSRQVESGEDARGIFLAGIQELLP